MFKNLTRAMMVALTVVCTIALGQKTDKFLAILGSVSCTPVAFIFPAAFHLKACANTTGQKIIDSALIIVWSGLGIFCTVLNLKDWNN
jgi:solute carrier family 36 (proton-coupled amino acid transporter)